MIRFNNRNDIKWVVLITTHLYFKRCLLSCKYKVINRSCDNQYIRNCKEWKNVEKSKLINYTVKEKKR